MSPESRVQSREPEDDRDDLHSRSGLLTLVSRLSIRWRLTLWNTLAVAALLVVCGLLVYGMLRQAMYRQTDQLLQSQFEELREDRQMATDHENRIPHWVHEFKEHVNVFAVVFDSRGQVFARTEGLADGSIPSSPACSKSRASAPHFATQTLPIIGTQRTLTGRLSVGNEQFTVVLMTPLADVETNLASVRNVLIAVLPVSLLLAGAIGYWLSRKALAPIEQLRAQTDEITAERLDQRLPIDNPDDELGRLTATINDMIARLEHSFAEIRRFTADASHELRTPLAVLRTEVEVAMGKPMDESQQHNLQQGRIDVAVTSTDDRVTATITDTGIGITNKHLAHVFDRFYRVDKARTREQGGTGLGLSIVKTIVAAHDGQIEIGSEQNQGTTCVVTLPMAAGIKLPTRE